MDDDLEVEVDVLLVLGLVVVEDDLDLRVDHVEVVELNDEVEVVVLV